MRIKRNIDESSARRIAVQAEVDPRTIKKIVRGDTVRGMAGERARKALVAAGWVK